MFLSLMQKWHKAQFFFIYATFLYTVDIGVYYQKSTPNMEALFVGISTVYKKAAQIFKMSLMPLLHQRETCNRTPSSYTVPLCKLPVTSHFNGWTCRVVLVLPHTKSANTACTKRS